MRIIAGSRKGLKLVTKKGMATRPTMDRTKETLFNMLSNVIAESRFLDLFSGSGAIGLEAVSRGAESAFLVENDKDAAKCILENIRLTRFEQKAKLLNMDVLQAFRLLEEQNVVFDIIFMDPPFDAKLEKNVLSCLSKSAVLHAETLIILEASADIQLDYITGLGFAIIKEKTYRTHKHIFVKNKLPDSV